MGNKEGGREKARKEGDKLHAEGGSEMTNQQGSFWSHFSVKRLVLGPVWWAVYRRRVWI